MIFNFYKLSWDSVFFQFNVGKIEGNVSSKEEIIYVDSIIQQNKYKLTYFSSFSKVDDKLIRESNLDWVLADKKLVYIKPLKAGNSLNKKIVTYRDEFELKDKLFELAVQSGINSRFSTDKNIGKSNFEKLYHIWMENSLNKKIAFEVLVYIENDQPAGFVTVGEKNGRADIGLIAVDEQFRGKGIGSKLMLGAEEWFWERGFNVIQVVTQRDNQPACKLYDRLGYKIESETYFYHIWDHIKKY